MNYLFIKTKVKSTLVNLMNFREKSAGVIRIIIHSVIAESLSTVEEVRQM